MAPQPDDETMPPVVTAIIKYGMTAIAAYLVYNLTTNVQASLASMQADERHTIEILQNHVEAGRLIQMSLDRNERVQLVLVDLLRQQCMNAAHNYSERNACFSAGSGR